MSDISPPFTNPLHNTLIRAYGLHQQGALSEAAALYRDVLAQDPRNFDALQLLGAVAATEKDFTAAVELFKRALAVNPDQATVHYNLGHVFEDLRRYREAAVNYDRAIALGFDNVLAHNNRGTALCGLRDYAGALPSFDAAIARDPSFAPAAFNRGVAQAELQDQAGALASFDKALAIDPSYPFLKGLRIFTKLRLCDWRGIEADIAAAAAALSRGESATAPWPAPSFVATPALQRKAAEIWSQSLHGDIVPASLPVRKDARKIRIGYFSPDFRTHPVAMLAAGVFEAHDRAAFETYAFAFGPDSDDEMRKRLVRSFHRFIDVRDQSDRAVAELARALGIDIAVDLAGYSADSRAGIFAHRAAPLQVSYLGFPATMGAPFMDYIFADRHVIPPAARAHYSESVITLPCFQPNDDKRAMSTREFTRAELGLPPQGAVFCGFGNANKINPAIFGAWMRILQTVPGSVLWLSDLGEVATTNLRAAAVAAGIDAARLVFAPHIAAGDHLARHKAADLFLDTLPFNAHATASDALWAGLPVLTCAGETFAGRVGASLLSALGLPDLIAATLAEYEGKAIALAGNPAGLGALRQRLGQARVTAALFSTTAITRRLEDAYRGIWQRAQSGQTPADTIVE